MSGLDEYYDNANNIRNSIVSDMASTSQFFDKNAPDWQDRQGSFAAGMSSGWEGTKGMVYGFKGLVADALGFEDAKLEAIDDMMEHSRRASVYGTGKVTDFTDIESFSDGTDWLAYGAGQVLPDLALALISGGIGASVGKAFAGKRIATELGRESLESYAEKLIGKSIVGKAGFESAENITSKQALNALKMGVGTKKNKDALATIWNTIERDFKGDMAKKFAGRANIAQSMVMSQGEAYQGTVEGGNPDWMKGAIFGSLAGLVEGYGENRILKGLFPEVIQTGASKGALRKFLTTLGTSMATEGATEAVQETIFEFNKALADDGWDVEKAFGEMANMTVLKRLANAFAMGSIGGGIMGGGTATMGAIYDHSSNQAQNAKDDAIAEKQELEMKAIADQEQAIVDQDNADYEAYQQEEALASEVEKGANNSILTQLKDDLTKQKDSREAMSEAIEGDEVNKAWNEKDAEITALDEKMEKAEATDIAKVKKTKEDQMSKAFDKREIDLKNKDKAKRLKTEDGWLAYEKMKAKEGEKVSKSDYAKYLETEKEAKKNRSIDSMLDRSERNSKAGQEKVDRYNKRKAGIIAAFDKKDADYNKAVDKLDKLNTSYNEFKQSQEDAKTKSSEASKNIQKHILKKGKKAVQKFLKSDILPIISALKVKDRKMIRAVLDEGGVTSMIYDMFSDSATKKQIDTYLDSFIGTHISMYNTRPKTKPSVKTRKEAPKAPVKKEAPVKKDVVKEAKEAKAKVTTLKTAKELRASINFAHTVVDQTRLMDEINDHGFTADQKKILTDSYNMQQEGMARDKKAREIKKGGDGKVGVIKQGDGGKVKDQIITSTDELPSFGMDDASDGKSPVSNATKLLKKVNDATTASEVKEAVHGLDSTNKIKLYDQLIKDKNYKKLAMVYNAQANIGNKDRKSSDVQAHIEKRAEVRAILKSKGMKVIDGAIRNKKAQKTDYYDSYKTKSEPKKSTKEAVKAKVVEKVTNKTPYKKVKQADVDQSSINQYNNRSLAKGLSRQKISIAEKKSSHIEEIAKVLFGKRVVWFEGKGKGSQTDGFVSRSDSNTVYLNVNAKKSLYIVLGHETYHLFDANTRADIDKKLTVLLKEGSLEGLRKNYNLDDKGLREELFADAFGHLLQNEAALQSIAQTVEGRGLIAQVIKAMEDFLKSLISNFGSPSDMSKELSKFYSEAFTDVEKAKDIMTSLAQKEIGKPKSKSQSKSQSNKTLESVNDDKFKRWFGRSKVVNKDGSPKVVFHFSPTTFTKFDPSKSADVFKGFHFGDKNQSDYAKEFHKDLGVKDGKTYGTYLAIDNPLVIDSNLARGLGQKWGWASLRNAIEDGKTSYDPKESDIDGFYEDEVLLNDGTNILEVAEYEFADAVKTWLKERGFDGIQYDNKDEGGGTAYIAFEPNQIKSIDNKGEFSKDSDDIYESLSEQLKGADGKIDLSFTKALKAITDLFDGGIDEHALRENKRTYKSDKEKGVTAKEIALDKTIPAQMQLSFGYMVNTADYNSFTREAVDLKDETDGRIYDNRIDMKPLVQQTLLGDDVKNKQLDKLTQEVYVTGKEPSMAGVDADVANGYKALRKITEKIKEEMKMQLSKEYTLQARKIKKKIRDLTGKKDSARKIKKLKEDMRKLRTKTDQDQATIREIILLPATVFNKPFVVRFRIGDKLHYEGFDRPDHASQFIDKLPKEAKGLPFTVLSKELDQTTRHFDTLAEAQKHADETGAVLHNPDGAIHVEKGYQDVIVDSLRDSSSISVNRASNLTHSIINEQRRGATPYGSEEGGHSTRDITEVAHSYLDKKEWDHHHLGVMDIYKRTPNSLTGTKALLKQTANTNLAYGKNDSMGWLASKVQSLVWNFKMAFLPAKALNNFPHLVTQMAMVLSNDPKLKQGGAKIAERMIGAFKATAKVWMMFFKTGISLTLTSDERNDRLLAIIENSDESAEWKHVAKEALKTAQRDSLNEFNLKGAREGTNDRSWRQWLEDVGNAMFQTSEIANRVATATYYNDVIKADGINEYANLSLEERTKWSVHDMKEVNFVFDKFNTPEVMQGGVGALSRPLMFPLMTFAFQSMSRTYSFMLRASIQENGKMHKGKFIGSFIKQYGIMAVPLLFFAGWGDEPEEFLAYASNGEITYGDGLAGDILRHGVLAEISGVDISSSVQQEIIPSPVVAVARFITGQESKNVVVGEAKAMIDFFGGEKSWRKFFKMMPNAIGKIWVNANDTRQGVIKTGRGETIEDFRNEFALMRYSKAIIELLGFNSTTRTNAYEKTYGRKTFISMVNAHGKRLTKELLRAQATGNQAGVTYARAKIEDFNENRAIYNEVHKEKPQKMITSKSIKSVKAQIKKLETNRNK